MQKNAIHDTTDHLGQGLWPRRTRRTRPDDPGSHTGHGSVTQLPPSRAEASVPPHPISPRAGDTDLGIRALALAVGEGAARRVRSLLTPISIGNGTTISQRLTLPRQAFFVLDGRLAITIADHPVAVLGPGSFFGKPDTTRMRHHDIPCVHALGPVVLGVAGPLELDEIHRLVPDLPSLTMAATVRAPDIGSQPVEDHQQHDHDDDAMGLGFLERIAS